MFRKQKIVILLIYALFLMVSCTPTMLSSHTITASCGANGSIHPIGEVTVTDGEEKTFIITPDTGYEISHVYVDGESVGAVTSYTFNNVTVDHTIYATFKAITPTQAPTCIPCCAPCIPCPVPTPKPTPTSTFCNFLHVVSNSESAYGTIYVNGLATGQYLEPLGAKNVTLSEIQCGQALTVYLVDPYGGVSHNEVVIATSPQTTVTFDYF